MRTKSYSLHTSSDMQMKSQIVERFSSTEKIQASDATAASFFSFTFLISQSHHSSIPVPLVQETVITSSVGLISRASCITASTEKGTYGSRSDFETSISSLVRNMRGY